MQGDLESQIIACLRRLVALLLWRLGAVKVSLEQPFTLVSGNRSPIYVNCRQLISSVEFADIFTAAARFLCNRENIAFDVVAGGETAGIPFATILSRGLSKPLIYVRKATKGHGLANLVEGVLPRSSRVLLTEDLITDGGSKLRFVDAIEAAGGKVGAVLVIFDRLQGGLPALAARGISLLSLTDIRATLAAAEEIELLSDDEIVQLDSYLQSPANWHMQKNFPYRT